jgi:dihydrodiol dehydrogenase / D-xylose 1-dehydrogenase (NADP)
MSKKINWGIMGTGMVARWFAEGLGYSEESKLIAVGSRSVSKAKDFAKVFRIPQKYSSYDELVQDKDIDVVYVATPHTFHKANSILALKAGKAVLCEKPFTINAHEAKELVQYARIKKLFLMEAMWTRFIPAVIKLKELLQSEIIGELRMLVADLGDRVEFDPKHRVFDPELGGGALLDVGVYPVSMASMIFGKPEKVTSFAHFGKTSVDEQEAILFGYTDGRLALLYASKRSYTPSEVILIGTKGRIRVHSPMCKPERLTLKLNGEKEEIIDIKIEGNGFNYETSEVARCILSGKLESDKMPLDETIQIMETMDRIRAQWGLKYPGE